MTGAAAASRVSTDTAWLSLVVNLLVLPGAGTLLLGRWFVGAAQILSSLFGFWLLVSDLALAEALGLGMLLGALGWSVTTAIGALQLARQKV